VDLQDVNISSQADTVHHLTIVGGHAADIGGQVVGCDAKVALGEDDDAVAGDLELFESGANDFFGAAV
jgi:hypothetical protein